MFLLQSLRLLYLTVPVINFILKSVAIFFSTLNLNKTYKPFWTNENLSINVDNNSIQENVKI